MALSLHKIAALTTTALALWCVAAPAAYAQAQQPTLDKIKASGKAVLGVREASPPMAYMLGAQDKYVGYHVELCERVLKEVAPAAKLEYMAITAQNTMALVSNGTVDIGCGPTTNNTARQQQVAFAVTTYVSEVRMAVRADSDIQSIEDLQGKTVSIGAEESGSEQNALQILSAYGLNDRLVDTINLNYTDAADQLKAGKIDAIVITVGIPSPVVTELAGECGIRLLNVDGTAAQRLLSSYNAYREVTIPAGTYPGQDADVQTVGVKAVLLASDSLPAKQVQQLTELLFSSREALEEQLGLALDPETDAVEGVGIPFHAGAAAWYKQAGITVD